MLISVETVILCTDISLPSISEHVTYHTGALAAFYSAELYHTITVQRKEFLAEILNQRKCRIHFTLRG
jgi:hypothetical protein